MGGTCFLSATFKIGLVYKESVGIEFLGGFVVFNAQWGMKSSVAIFLAFSALAYSNHDGGHVAPSLQSFNSFSTE